MNNIENMNLATLEFHELANEFPLISEEETQQLAEDIKKNGLIEPVVLFEGKILDGRNRYNACKLAGRKLGESDVVQFEEEYDEDDPVVFVISKNIRRRHLTVGQRAAVAAELFKRMAKSDGATAKERTKKAAAATQVAASSVEQASHVQKVAPEIHKDLKAGKTTLHKAAKQAAKKVAGTTHDAALLRIKEVCGKPFEAAVREDQISALNTPKQIIAFASLSEADMKAVAPVLRQGWKLNRAMGFIGKALTPSNTLAQAIDFFHFKGDKKFEFELDSVKITLTKIANKEGDKSAE